ncbi:N-acetylmuramoyl-L-alanine amidase [Haliea sp. AH-315-K21]|nr:N-acetylmuramoyl-L-alanine amidase [Haliea sp. AH-315-K21]
MSTLSSALFSTMVQAAIVENVRTYRAPDYTRLVFDLSEQVEHQIFSLENPNRLVIDLSDATLFANFSDLNLSGTPISNIRSAARNDNDTRVVLDLNAAVQARSFLLEANDQYGNRLVVDLYDNGSSSNDRGEREPVITASADDIANNKRDIVVAISAGHGGDDPGAIGVDRIQEKRVVLAIARQIESILNQMPGYRPVMVRDGDYYVGLRGRTNIAHQNNADFFIAIHADAFTSSSARGATVYALSRRGATSEQARRMAEKENGADLIGGVGSVSLADKDEVLVSVLLDLSMTASIASSLEAGDKIISALGNVTRMRRTSVEQAAFVVLKQADIPSLLIEAGYITNPTDARNLNSPSYQQQFASAVVSGITAYFYTTPPRGTLIAWHKNNGGGPSAYIVTRGDNLSEIAERFNVSLAALQAANNISDSVIQLGQELIIPNALMPVLASVSFREHVVSSGESLSQIAEDYAVPLQRIRATNQLNSDTIWIGQILRIPSS